MDGCAAGQLINYWTVLYPVPVCRGTDERANGTKPRRRSRLGHHQRLAWVAALSIFCAVYPPGVYFAASCWGWELHKEWRMRNRHHLLPVIYENSAGLCERMPSQSGAGCGISLPRRLAIWTASVSRLWLVVIALQCLFSPRLTPSLSTALLRDQSRPRSQSCHAD